MEQRLSLVTLGVRDVGRARWFYEALGWQAGFGNEEVVFFQLHGMILALWDRAAMDKDMLREGSPRGSAGVALAQNQRSREEVDAVMTEAAAAGATIVKPAQETYWGGYSGYFTDLDGHGWEIAWNPGWRIDENGDVHLKSSGTT